ncbi:uncharacterized protein LOC144828451 [Lissotriton helveticus]
MVGRYVSVVITGRKEYLTLCGVEVYGVLPPQLELQLPNLALQGTATQSSQYPNLGLPSYPLNTQRNGNYFEKYCSSTNGDKNPWWRLDLGQSQPIGSVVVVNRADCCPQRLRGAEVLIGDDEDNNNPVCGTITDLSAGSVTTLYCKGMVGRYVSVVITGRREYLTLCGVEVYGVLPPQLPSPSVSWNLALEGTASQSSQYPYLGLPSYPLNTNRNGNYYEKYCSSTNGDMNPWWRVDLGQSQPIRSIVVVNRADCCPERLRGAEVRVGDSKNNNNPVCGTITDLSAGSITTLYCKGMVGRYVSVVITGRREFLTLCGVEVYGVVSTQLPNLALEGTASQSSLYPYLGQPSYPLNSDRNGNDLKKYCSATNGDMNPWWKVDLGQSQPIGTVVVVHAAADCCPERLRDAEVRVGDNENNDNPVCGTITDLSRGSITTLCCKGMVGRYVSVVITGRREYLTLCGVEVYGCLPPQQPNLALEGTASQSSQYPDLGLPSYPLNNNRNGNYYEKYCSATNGDMNPWWRLDLGQSQSIGSVVVVNRADCCPERLRGAEVRIGDNKNNNNPVCGTITDLSAGSVTVLCCKGMVGRYVSVVIKGRKEYLTLCGVEVYSVLPSQQPSVCCL